MNTSARRRAEMSELAQLGSVELRRGLVGISSMHSALADSVFSGLRLAIGPRVDAARAVHDAISIGTYGAVAASATAVARIAELAADTPGRPPSETHRGAAALSVLNGLIGDELDDTGSILATGMSPRIGGRPVTVSAASLRAAYPDARSHVVIFLHGLMESEFAWSGHEKPSYGQRFEADLGATEVQVRYNTGRHISDSGRDLAELLSHVVLLWPVPVTELTLIGHSMGGLVIRSACHVGADSYWLGLVRHTVSLGTPHLGAPLARGVHAATAALRTNRATRPLGNFLGRRSAGVRDLFHGTLTDDGWRGGAGDSWWQARAGDLPPLVPHARHLFVTASLTRDPHHPLGRLVGDGLVLDSSGRGESRSIRIGFQSDDGLHIGKANHFTLLNDDAVYEWLLARLRPRRALPAA